MERDGVKVTPGEHYDRVELQSATRPPPAHYLRKGWALSDDFDEFPTLTRPCPVAVPRWRTPGVDTASAEAIAAWKEDQHRRSPIHYEPRNKLQSTVPSGGNIRERYLQTIEIERLAGFEKDYTLTVWKSARRKNDPVGYADARGCLLGNAYDPTAMAFLIAELAWHWGMLAKPVDIE